MCFREGSERWDLQRKGGMHFPCELLVITERNGSSEVNPLLFRFVCETGWLPVACGPNPLPVFRQPTS